ncbi:hypothetical protein NADFUDRAFT_69563 [Nadsonia fulvescens var. elongata DSM 6958]|uniref:Zn(2)-C6 fungal-type domain-containing protein n=1 Tax=Nadsonia fulvescens var. elongata DSM 6958 TaxID=857566 RepID=A0A1E3PLN7_9ASCO|nr:hypothetical protein NADFUDRAFT_69563 [Nadsonia fulvescens var. elongata DSM 6958]
MSSNKIEVVTKITYFNKSVLLLLCFTFLLNSLTCRERHLKCDETFPICENCQKSQRDCYRGLKLKFTYTNVKEPKILLVDRDNYSIKFMDESREIASNYLNCRESYIPYDKLIEDVSTRPPSTTCKGLFTKSLNPLQKAPFLSTDSGISINPKLQLKQPLLSNHFSVFLNKKTPPIRDVITS